jgi:hypothetical protein
MGEIDSTSQLKNDIQKEKKSMVALLYVNHHRENVSPPTLVLLFSQPYESSVVCASVPSKVYFQGSFYFLPIAPLTHTY